MKIKTIIILLLLVVAFALIGAYTSMSGGDAGADNWSYSKSEYPLEEYHLNELPVSHKSTVEVKRFFEDSDADHDGVLKGNEINTFDYKIKHSQYTFNGPYGYN